MKKASKKTSQKADSKTGGASKGTARKSAATKRGGKTAAPAKVESAGAAVRGKSKAKQSDEAVVDFGPGELAPDPAEGKGKKKRKNEQPKPRVDIHFVSQRVHDLLVQKGLWDSADQKWTAAAEPLLRSGYLVSERLDAETRLRLIELREEDRIENERKEIESQVKKAEQARKRAASGKVFRLSDEDRRQIIGEMIQSLRQKLGNMSRALPADMIKLLQLEKELAPPAQESPKRVAVVFVPPKDMDKYVLREDAPE